MATHFYRAQLTRSVAGAFTAMVFCTAAAFLVDTSRKPHHWGKRKLKRDE
jgi:hypothetical protein